MPLLKRSSGQVFVCAQAIRRPQFETIYLVTPRLARMEDVG